MGPLAGVVTGWLEEDWRPQQISVMLPMAFPDDKAMRVSHETIYQSRYVESCGEVRRELAAHLRTGRPARRPMCRTLIQFGSSLANFEVPP